MMILLVGDITIIRVFPSSEIVIYAAIIISIIMFPWICFIVLSANRKAAKLIMTSFEFCLKMYQVVVLFGCSIANIIIQHHQKKTKIVVASTQAYVDDDYALNLAMRVGALPYALGAVLFIFALDAYKIRKTIKFIFPTIFAVIMFGIWIDFILFKYGSDGEDVSLVKITDNIYISLYSQQQEACYILFLFCFKQALLTIYRERDKNVNKKATSIKKVPRLKWEKYFNTNSNEKQHGMYIQRIFLFFWNVTFCQI